MVGCGENAVAAAQQVGPGVDVQIHDVQVTSWRVSYSFAELGSGHGVAATGGAQGWAYPC